MRRAFAGSGFVCVCVWWGGPFRGGHGCGDTERCDGAVFVHILQYVPRLMTTGWGRALMKTPLIGQAVGMFAKGYAGIVASELKKCAPPPARFRLSSLQAGSRSLCAAPRQLATRSASATGRAPHLAAHPGMPDPCADGLRHEDVMVVTPDIDEALRRMDPYELDMRNKRLKVRPTQRAHVPPVRAAGAARPVGRF